MSRWASRSWSSWTPDVAIALGLVIGYVWLLLGSVHDLGYARDEGFYFHAAAAYEEWFTLLFRDPAAALRQDSVDRYWVANHEHPALMKALFALSHRYLYSEWHWFSEAGTAYRFPGMVVSSLGIGVVFLWGRLSVGRLAGVVGALLLGLMPRVFYHSHLDCFDMPVASLWVATTFVYWLSIQRNSLPWALVAGLLYGLLLNTKHNAWLLPFALVTHVALTQGPKLWRELRVGRATLPTALFTMALIGPLVFYATWPWIWFDTADRITWWVQFHLRHEYYNMEFLGQTYWRPPMPRLYAPVMTLASVPAITLLCAALGLGGFVTQYVNHGWFAALIPRAQNAQNAAVSDKTMPGDWRLPAKLEPRALRRALLLWALCLALSYAPWLSTTTPIFGGTKHWITAYPFLCLFAGLGFAVVADRVRALFIRCGSPLWSAAVPYVVAVALLIGPAKMTYDSHPWGLGFYAPAVGGAPGAATLGLNRSFWGYTTGSVVPFLNERVPPRGTVYVHDTALQSWEMLVRDGRLRSDIRGTLRPHGADVALYHHEQHMSRVEHQVWVLYGTTAPAHVATYHGVPVIWVYTRRSATRP